LPGTAQRLCHQERKELLPTNAATPTRQRKATNHRCERRTRPDASEIEPLSWWLKRQGISLTVLSGRCGPDLLEITECCRE
jgi:hypothetical protein